MQVVPETACDGSRTLLMCPYDIRRYKTEWLNDEVGLVVLYHLVFFLML